MPYYRDENKAMFPFEDAEALRRFVAEHYLAGSWCLEFGPGCSTLALLDAGIATVHTYEYTMEWADRAKQLFDERGVTPEQVRVGLYSNEPRLTLGDLHPPAQPRELGVRYNYDLALVDSPIGNKRRRVFHDHPKCSRLNTLAFALSHAMHVLLHDAGRTGEIESVIRLGCDLRFLTPRLAYVMRRSPV